MNRIRTIFSALLVTVCATMQAQEAKLVKDIFLYEDGRIPTCHAATIVEATNGDMLIAFFGGIGEGKPDSVIWLSRKEKGSDSWSLPQVVADGIYTEYTKSCFSKEDLEVCEQRELNEEWWMQPAPSTGTPLIDIKTRKSCYNPVLFQIPGGDLVLYYKMGHTIVGWSGWQMRSKDNGKTWSHPIALPEGFLGPIKNKPVYSDGRIIASSSTELGDWAIHFENSDDMGESWNYVGDLKRKNAVRTEDMLQEKPAPMPIQCIQPSIIFLPGGKLAALSRTRNGQIAVCYSKDNGNSWSKIKLIDMMNNNSGIDAVTMDNGLHALVYNNCKTVPGEAFGARTPLCLAISKDGKHWENVMTLEDSNISEYSYPSIIQGSNGNLHIVYTWRRQRIVYKEVSIQ